MKPFSTHEPSERRSGFSRRPILLARLPHVGASTAVDIEPPASETMPLDQPSAASEHQHRNQMYVDHAHLAPEIVEFPSSSSQMPEVEHAIEQPTSSNNSYYRHDRTHLPRQRHPESRSPQVRNSSLANVQGSITSYSGLIVALILAGSAILLLLTIVSPTEPPSQHYGEQFELYGSAAEEIPPFDRFSKEEVKPLKTLIEEPLDLFAEQQTLNSNDSATESNEDVDQFDWDDAFHASQEPTERISAKPARPESQVAPEAIELPAVDVEPIVEEEPLLTDPSAAKYPRTDHPEFDLSALGVTKGVESGAEDSASTNPELAKLPPLQNDASLNR